MLHDITAQTIHVNTELACIHHKDTKRRKTQKHVTFDAEGIACMVEILMTALETEKQQNARLNSEPRTPSKAKDLERPLIGNSSTWRNDELDRFMVEQRVLDVRRMIPEKWFDFGKLDNYQSCTKPTSVFGRERLIIVRDQITSVTSDEITNNRVIVQKAPHFISTFRNLQDLRRLNVTDTRQDNLAEKRYEKRHGRPISTVPPEWVGPPLPPLTAEEAHRIASISDPSKSSAGSRLFTATQEKDSESLATSFFQNVLMLLFFDDPPVAWATGRDDAKPVLLWRNRYLPIHRSFFLLY
jgi:hypothetical protein